MIFRNSDGCLFVRDKNVAPCEKEEQLAITPQIVPVVKPGSPRLDHAYIAVQDRPFGHGSIMSRSGQTLPLLIDITELSS